jgi:hypothetical protein
MDELTQDQLTNRDGYTFPGTMAEWRELHTARCREVGPITRVRYLTGRTGRVSAVHAYCTPRNPCDGCREWAHRRVQKAHDANLLL